MSKGTSRRFIKPRNVIQHDYSMYEPRAHKKSIHDLNGYAIKKPPLPVTQTGFNTQNGGGFTNETGSTTNRAALDMMSGFNYSSANSTMLNNNTRVDQRQALEDTNRLGSGISGLYNYEEASNLSDNKKRRGIGSEVAPFIPQEVKPSDNLAARLSSTTGNPLNMMETN
jgi:hypothetical protein